MNEPEHKSGCNKRPGYSSRPPKAIYRYSHKQRRASARQAILSQRWDSEYLTVQFIWPWW